MDTILCTSTQTGLQYNVEYIPQSQFHLTNLTTNADPNMFNMPLPLMTGVWHQSGIAYLNVVLSLMKEHLVRLIQGWYSESQSPKFP